MMWADFSAWLVTVGVIFAYLAAIFALIDFPQPVDPRSFAVLAARDRRRGGADLGRRSTCSFIRATRVDFGRAVGPRALGRNRAGSRFLHGLDGKSHRL